MPNYNISVVVDPAAAEGGIQVVETRLGRLGTRAAALKTSLQRAFDFSSGAKASRDISVVDSALDGLKKSATDAATGVFRINDALKTMSAPSLGAARSIDQINTNLQRLYGTTEQQAKAQTRLINSNAQVRASTLSMGQQFNDFSTQVLSGQSVVTAFAQQSGQAAFALQGFNGTLGTVGKFLAGPWGTILIIATTVLAGFVAKIIAQGDALNKAVSDLKEEAAETEINRKAKAIFKTTTEGVIAAIYDQQEALDKSAKAQRTAAEQANYDAKINLDRLQTIRNTTAALIEQAIAMEQIQKIRASAPGQRGENASLTLDTAAGRVAQLQALQAKNQAALEQAQKNYEQSRAGLGIEQAQRAAEGLASPEGRINKLYEDRKKTLEATYRTQFNTTKETEKQVQLTNQLARDLAKIQKERDDALKAQQRAESAANRTTRTPQQTFADFERELKKRGIERASGASGHRTAADQNRQFRAGLSPLDGYNRLSRHQSDQALDPSRATQNDQLAREAAQAAGLKGFRIVNESGGRKHYEWTGSGQRGQADVAGSESAAAKAQREAEAAQRRMDSENDFVQQVVSQSGAKGTTNRADALQATIGRTLDDFKRRFNKAASPEQSAKIAGSLTKADARETAAYFEDAYIKPLDRLIALQGKTGQEREVLNKQLEETARLGRALTPVEKQQIENSIKRGDALKLESSILEDVKQPQEQYALRIAALNKLLKEGAINQISYNSRVSDLGAAARDSLSNMPGRDPNTNKSYSELSATGDEDARYAHELESFQNNKDQLLQMGINYDALVEQAAREHQRRLYEIDRAGAQTRLAQAQGIAESLLTIAEATVGKQTAVYKALFVVQKAFAIASSIIDIQKGIASAASLPFPENLAAIASVVAATASIVSNIQAVALNFADGGLVRGPGSSRSDSIPANLSDGEFVVNAQATRNNRSLLETINSGKRPTLASSNDNRGSGGGEGDIHINIGDINVQGASGDGKEVGRNVKNAIIGIVRTELKTQGRSGGTLTRTQRSVMANS